ncbi:hypothetical protein O6H91_13G044500 [Diphasiastrum complanatum]|uniref:Uncharacterized protein n=1 Tax=Diphasiastrum complanatum TaxID=34168 RepID=A0ACC2BUB2_DIPCM|nr:hypothetical protein O6H91_13G044500 [Diphasiastrum complanatum]
MENVMLNKCVYRFIFITEFPPPLRVCSASKMHAISITCLNDLPAHSKRRIYKATGVYTTHERLYEMSCIRHCNQQQHVQSCVINSSQTSTTPMARKSEKGHPIRYKRVVVERRKGAIRESTE